MKIMIGLFAFVVISIAGFAQSQSEDFILRRSVIDAAGGRASSESFDVVTAAGQPTPIGKQTSEAFLLRAGFLAPMVAVSPFSPIQRLVIRPDEQSVWLYWEPVPEAQSYAIYSDTTALFAPAPSNWLAGTMDTVFVHFNATLDPTPRRFYVVTASAELPLYSPQRRSDRPNKYSVVE